MFWLIVLLLVAAVVATPPVYPYSRRWGYSPAAVVGAFLFLALVLWWLAWLPGWIYPAEPAVPTAR